MLPLTTFYRSGAHRSDVYKWDAFVTSWRFYNRAWQPQRHDRLPETSGTLWIHRGALTNQRCSLATGCGIKSKITGDPLHSRAFAHSRVPLFTQPCPHCSHSRAPGEQWARLCVFTLQGCVQAARLCRGSPVKINTYFEPTKDTPWERLQFRRTLPSPLWPILLRAFKPRSVKPVVKRWVKRVCHFIKT